VVKRLRGIYAKPSTPKTTSFVWSKQSLHNLILFSISSFPAEDVVP